MRFCIVRYGIGEISLIPKALATLTIPGQGDDRFVRSPVRHERQPANTRNSSSLVLIKCSPFLPTVHEHVPFSTLCPSSADGYCNSGACWPVPRRAPTSWLFSTAKNAGAALRERTTMTIPSTGQERAALRAPETLL